MADPLENIGEEIRKKLKDLDEFAFSQGKIPLKYKYLIAMAIDASHGASEGVKALADEAIKNGATKDEINEVLRIVLYIAGAGGVFPAAQGLKNLK